MPDFQTDLDLTISTLEKDLTTVSANDAIAIIENWQHHFQGHRLAGDLEQLKHAISMGNRSAIADILLAAGKDASGEAASRTADDVSPKILELGNLLNQVGNSLK